MVGGKWMVGGRTWVDWIWIWIWDFWDSGSLLFFVFFFLGRSVGGGWDAMGSLLRLVAVSVVVQYRTIPVCELYAPLLYWSLAQRASRIAHLATDCYVKKFVRGISREGGGHKPVSSGQTHSDEAGRHRGARRA